MADEGVEQATIELLGALAYGQLRAFETAARVIRFAPDAHRADQLADLAVREHVGYQRLRDHLASRTDLATAAMDRQKPHFDDYFDRVELRDWFGACTFFALGLPLAADFSRDVAPALDGAAREAVLSALAERDAFETFAVSEVTAVELDDARREQARQMVADLLGRALTGFQGIVEETDALKVLLAGDREPDETAEGRVKRLVLSVMNGHRRRVVELGFEDLDDEL